MNNQLGLWIDHIREAKSVFIFGLSSTKDELKEHLSGNNLGANVVGIETSDSITNLQIAPRFDSFLWIRKIKFYGAQT